MTMITQHLRSVRNVSFMCAAMAFSVNATAATSVYQIAFGSDYSSEGFAAGGVPVLEASADVLGSITVDTSTGELISFDISLGTYNSQYSYTNPWTDFAIFEVTESQSLTTPVVGTEQNGSIAYTGLEFTASGSVSCLNSMGANGNAACGTPPSIDDWGPISMVFMFTPDAEALVASAVWSSSEGDLEINHNLDFFAVKEVPLPASGWLMLTALAGLVSSKSARAKWLVKY